MESSKPLQDLTLDDLKRHPVWRYRVDRNSGREYIDPTSINALSEDDETPYVASTRYCLADGTEIMGFCSPQDSSGLDYLVPVMIVSGMHIPLWHDKPVDAEIVERFWKQLAKSESEVFPLTYECIVPVDGLIVRGTIASLKETGAT